MRTVVTSPNVTFKFDTYTTLGSGRHRRLHHHPVPTSANVVATQARGNTVAMCFIRQISSLIMLLFEQGRRQHPDAEVITLIETLSCVDFERPNVERLGCGSQ